MAVTRTPSAAWVDQGLRALATGGPDAVRVEALARELGVTKGGFYWHFEDRQALLNEMLRAWERKGVDAVIAEVEAAGDDARSKLSRLFSLASSTEGGKVELAVRDWARRDPSVRRRLRRVDNRRMDYLRSLFREFCVDEDELEARCVMAMAVFIGLHFMAADHGERSRADVLGLLRRHLLA